MDVWTWGGKYFGYFEGKALFTYDGTHVGLRDGDEIYDEQGNYLGEVRGDRLITSNAKSSWRSFGFVRSMKRIPQVPVVRYIGNVMQEGHRDFPDPEDFNSA